MVVEEFCQPVPTQHIERGTSNVSLEYLLPSREC